MADTDPLGEAQAFEEFWALQTDPIFRGEGIPQGDGARVLVIPGLLANDFYLMTMHTWLNRIGYQPITSDILWNVGCPKRLMGSIADKLSGLLSKDDNPIHLVELDSYLGVDIYHRMCGKVTHHGEVWNYRGAYTASSSWKGEL